MGCTFFFFLLCDLGLPLALWLHRFGRTEESANSPNADSTSWRERRPHGALAV